MIWKTPNGEPEEILLANLDKEYYRLEFLVDEGNENLKREMEISIKAGDLVGELYDEMHKLYIDPENDKAVMEAYGFDWRKMTESECVAELMKMYQKIAEKEKNEK